MSNHLKNTTSPYLLQHAENPVNWYPWCEDAFEKAKQEDKPIFLSIGYSTCHWCHVMAYESFENEKMAEILNRYFVSIKVDREERPDIDSVYMTVCQAFTGSGGWPMSIFMTWDKKPFFAGTYFSPKSHYGMPGFPDLLNAIASQWNNNRRELLQSAEQIVSHLKNERLDNTNTSNENLIEQAIQIFSDSFDEINGGFGSAPKFPTPHNLLLLMLYAKQNQDSDVLKMAEKTLLQMRKGGIFDHIGYGFSRYSTDKYFLVPHFEKMLYDNALLMIAYSAVYSLTNNEIYLDTAEKTAEYILREMASPDGGFYSAQDADSEGVEGKYYKFTIDDIVHVLGEEKGK
ncbi:MAG: thioredoxin domain-containing protein, partial [Ruminococcus sp.]|nr:thioredoxin domain-containing protein [Ruminococcus sp.]